MPLNRRLVALTAALLLGALPVAAAHKHKSSTTMAMPSSTEAVSMATNSKHHDPSTFFRDAHHAGWMYAHIGLMIASWTIVLPAALMLSLARSRFHLPAQLLFHSVNSVGFFTGFVYHHSMPDYYPKNAHNPIGWVATSFTVAWTVMSMFVAYSQYMDKSALSVSDHNNSSRYSRLEPFSDRTPRNSGHSFFFGFHSRQGSADSVLHKEEGPESPVTEEHHPEASEDEQQRRGFLGNNRVDRFISHNVSRFSSQRGVKFVRINQVVIEKLLLLLGFLAITTGFVTWGGIFQARKVFNGLAHWIKGGIFFWYGVLTLGRWMGAFAEFGWAWNVRPPHPTVARWKTRVPSAEFVESFVIWLYGASNVFLEHLTARGKPWSAQDLEHVSITMLFFGGGLMGMLVELRSVRNLIDTAVVLQRNKSNVGGEFDNAGLTASSRFDTSAAEQALAPDETAPQQRSPTSSDRAALWQQPASASTSLNPLPALVIMLLGLMMSSHHQSSMVSTMLHAQWGRLFCGFALARASTYILMYVRPPTSHFASRPPSELVAAFCLIAGGMLFMLSSRDTVEAIEDNGLEAMAVFTVTVGFTGLLMAWEVLCFALKGWAMRKELAASGNAI